VVLHAHGDDFAHLENPGGFTFSRHLRALSSVIGRCLFGGLLECCSCRVRVCVGVRGVVIAGVCV